MGMFPASVQTVRNSTPANFVGDSNARAWITCVPHFYSTIVILFSPHLLALVAQAQIFVDPSDKDDLPDVFDGEFLDLFLFLAVSCMPCRCRILFFC